MINYLVLGYFGYLIGRRLIENRYGNVGLAFNTVEGIRSSVLVTHFTYNRGFMQAEEGVVDGMHYTVFVTVAAPYSIGYSGAAAAIGSVVYRFELPFHTSAHILGIGKAFDDSKRPLKLYAKLQRMERVKLEGSFSDIFTLFAGKDQQAQTRYVFDPKAMEHVMDYCQNVLWEIIGDELYVVVDGAASSATSDVVASSMAFVKEIKPALISRFAEHDKPHRAPYGKHRGGPMKCPICQQALIELMHWFECPRHHGRLINGGRLIAVKQGSISVAPLAKEHSAEHPELTCPKCTRKMELSNYESTGIMIDVCVYCGYRWLDAGELARISL